MTNIRSRKGFFNNRGKSLKRPVFPKQIGTFTTSIHNNFNFSGFCNSSRIIKRESYFGFKLKAKQDDQKRKRTNPNNYENFSSNRKSNVFQSEKDYKKRSNGIFIGIRNLTNKVSNWIHDTSTNSTVVHKINYFDNSITKFLYRSIKIDNDEDYIQYLNNKFYNALIRRCESLNIKQAKYQRYINNIRQYNFWYYAINFYYLSSNVSGLNIFQTSQNIKTVRIPRIFLDIISHFKSRRILPQNNLETNQVRHIFDNSQITDVIYEIKQIINYPNIDDYTDDFGEAYINLMSLLDVLHVASTELKSSISTVRYIHTGLYSHLNFVGSDYFINLNEFMYNLLFMKTVEIKNGEDSYIYRPDLFTVEKQDSEHHIVFGSLNTNFTLFFNDQLGRLPDLKLSQTLDESSADDDYGIESSTKIQKTLSRQKEESGTSNKNPEQIGIDIANYDTGQEDETS